MKALLLAALLAGAPPPTVEEVNLRMAQELVLTQEALDKCLVIAEDKNEKLVRAEREIERLQADLVEDDGVRLGDVLLYVLVGLAGLGAGITVGVLAL